MLNKIKIPVAIQITIDDLGWHDGRDYTNIGKASRSGIPRDHVLSDYQFMNELGRALNQKILGKLCLADWDKDNLLRGEIGITDDPINWDRAHTIDMDYAKACFEEMEKSEYLEYCVHSIMHGRYDETGHVITEKELFEKQEGGGWLPISNEELDRRLDLFFKIYNSWGFKQKLKVYGAPCGAPEQLSGVQLAGLNAVLYKYGIRYFRTHWAYFHSYEENVSFPVKYIASNRRLAIAMPWDKYDVDVKSLPDAYRPDEKNIWGLIALHWTNFLRLDPEENFKYLPDWIDFFNRQSEYFGAMISRDFEFSAIQQFYYHFAKVDFADGAYTIDLSYLLAQNFDDIKREFYISLKNDVTPKSCEGGEVTLYEEKRDFKTYKVTYTDDKVRITV